MVGAILMSHFMRHIVYIKSVSYWCAKSGDSTCFFSSTRGIQGCNTSTPSAKHVSNVIITATYYVITGCLIFTQHRLAIIIGIWIGSAIKVNDRGVVGNNDHGYCEVSLI